jgi:hypothetical protein
MNIRPSLALPGARTAPPMAVSLSIGTKRVGSIDPNRAERPKPDGRRDPTPDGWRDPGVLDMMAGYRRCADSV